jgi:hypothetical protein
MSKMNDAEQLKNDSLAIAASRKQSDKEFLESMSNMDALVDHEDGCGQCEHQRIMAQTARDLLAAGNITDGIKQWSDESMRRWNETKYVKLWHEEVAAGRDPHKAFEERGWEP